MPPNATKRRRVDNASSTLSKPFKSPLRRQPVSSEDPSNDHHEVKPGGPLSSSCTVSTLVDSAPAPSPGNVTDGTTKSDSVNPKRKIDSSKQPCSLTPSKLSTPAANASAELAALRKQESALLSRLVSLRQDLDTVSQALKIEKTSQDEELKQLLDKWKGVSREAAEELFVGARDRVNRMGGVGVWKEKMRNAKTRRWDDENDGGRKDGDDDEYEDNKEKEKKRREIEDQIDAGNVSNGDGEESEGDDEETFTMDMMLKSLNVDLESIGFDKTNQRWID